MSSAEPDYIAVNREVWTRTNAKWGDAHALETWLADEITWGTWGWVARKR